MNRAAFGLHRQSQPSTARSQQPASDLDVTDRPSQEFRFGWIGPREAMAHLGIGSQTALYRLISDHRLPFGRLGRLYRFRRADLDQWALVQGAEAKQALTGGLRSVVR